MILSFREGEVTLLYVPFDAHMDEYRRANVEAVLTQNDINLPDWDAYNDMLEGYILDDDTCEKEAMDLMNDDDHVDAYFNVDKVFDQVSEKLRDATGIEGIMVCRGKTGFCDLPHLAS